MPEAAVNFFKADLRAIEFTLYEHLKVQQLFELERFSHLSREDCDATIQQCLRFVSEVTGPLNGAGDRIGCVHENGATRAMCRPSPTTAPLAVLSLTSRTMPQPGCNREARAGGGGRAYL